MSLVSLPQVIVGKSLSVSLIKESSESSKSLIQLLLLFFPSTSSASSSDFYGKESRFTELILLWILNSLNLSFVSKESIDSSCLLSQGKTIRRERKMLKMHPEDV